MNYTETFNDFASRVTTFDLALYAGAALILFVLFQDKLGPVNTFVRSLLQKVSLPKVPSITNSSPSVVVPNKEDLFFQLMHSWKQTRDLAVRSNCTDAVKVADQMFPFLSPNACGSTQTTLTTPEK
jgi:hypothetical protein